MYFSPNPKHNRLVPISNPSPLRESQTAPWPCSFHPVIHDNLPPHLLNILQSYFLFPITTPTTLVQTHSCLDHCSSFLSFLPPSLPIPTQLQSATKTIFLKLWLWLSLFKNLPIVLYHLEDKSQTLCPALTQPCVSGLLLASQPHQLPLSNETPTVHLRSCGCSSSTIFIISGPPYMYFSPPGISFLCCPRDSQDSS